MVDALTISGTAVGVVSLGIQVFQGLVTYYENWKSADDDIAHALNKINALESMLEHLQRFLSNPGHSNANIVDEVNKSIISCASDIDRLGAFLDKCHSLAPPNSVKGKAHRVAQKSLYSFKKATIRDLMVNLTDLQNNLHTSLQLLEL